MNTGHFYFISDAYYTDFPDKMLMQNKEAVCGVPHNRPCFYSFYDNSTGLFWMIPISSRVEKYRVIYSPELLFRAFPLPNQSPDKLPDDINLIRRCPLQPSLNVIPYAPRNFHLHVSPFCPPKSAFKICATFQIEVFHFMVYTEIVGSLPPPCPDGGISCLPLQAVGAACIPTLALHLMKCNRNFCIALQFHAISDIIFERRAKP